MKHAWLLVPLALGLAAGPASAVTLRRMEIAEVARLADAVVVGTVSRQWCERDADRPKLIVTRVTLVELTVLRGPVTGRELTLTFAGGRLGDEEVLVPGMPTFRDGERVLLCVGIGRRWFCPVVGWWQGRFGLVRDEATGRLVVEDGQGRRIAGIADGRVVLRPEDGKDLDADAFLEEVRRLLPPADDGPAEDEETGR